jgi:malate dehydrogenase (oxaloacetate-decarboxylating)(NADP+)
MKLAATRALAQLAREDVPESVAHAYDEESFQFGPDYIIPKPFDSRVLLWVAPAVARAAIEDGVARHEIDPEEYRTALEARLGRRREVMRDIMLQAHRDPRRIIFTDGEHDRVIRAVSQVVSEGIAKPVLLGRPARIRKRAESLHVDLTGIELVDPTEDEELLERYGQRLYERRQRKGITLSEARDFMKDPAYFGNMMVAAGDADGLIAGMEAHYPETIRPALEVVGTQPNVNTVAGLYMMILKHDLVFFADTTVNIRPDAETLAEIALLSAEFVKRLGVDPRVALLSFSNFGSARNPESEVVRKAVQRLKELRPELAVDGEMQADTALVEEILNERYPFNTLGGPANVLIFPDLNSSNIAYKLLSRIGGAEAIGPILLGMDRPVHVLQRGSEAADVVNLTALAVVDAQRRGRKTQTPE